MMLLADAEKIFKMKYARTLPNGEKESWEQASTRVAEYVSRAEQTESNRLQYLADFTKIILEKSFIPGGRILANAGSEVKNLMNCFVMPIEDTRQSVYKTLGYAAEIFAWGGGVGYNFSKMREQGAKVVTTGGKASGPISFMELFDTTGEVISQASRRGAQMGILNVDHPDILKFIEHKSIPNERNKRIYKELSKAIGDKEYDGIISKTLSDTQLTHFNVSVALPDAFMRALKGEGKWALFSPTGKMKEFIDPDIIMDAICYNAWSNGDPGAYFIDRANEYNLVPYLGSLDATNPCGEVPLLPYEPCCLGSINLSNFVEDDFVDLTYLREVVRYSVRFLDNVHELNETPIEEINKAAKATRRLGLGVMGFADVLAEMGIEYDSEDALSLAKVLGSTIQREAWATSMALAVERGAFPAYDAEKINWKLIDQIGAPHIELRNVAVTSIAPTGTIALIAGVNNGIEPFFGKEYKRNITEGIGNEAIDSINNKIAFRTVKTAHNIHWKSHIDMQAMWQRYTDNAVSKTINMHNKATVDEVKEAIMYAWESGCKGVTVYRDRSRAFQILEV